MMRSSRELGIDIGGTSEPQRRFDMQEQALHHSSIARMIGKIRLAQFQPIAIIKIQQPCRGSTASTYRNNFRSQQAKVFGPHIIARMK